MGFLSTLKAFFVGLGELVGFIKDKQLIDAGKDAERGKRAENALKDIKHVKKIKDDVNNLDDDELLNELRNPDSD